MSGEAIFNINFVTFYLQQSPNNSPHIVTIICPKLKTLCVVNSKFYEINSLTLENLKYIEAPELEILYFTNNLYITYLIKKI